MKDIGYENSPIPREEMDARELVPEMMRRLWAGEPIDLVMDKEADKWRLADYVERVADWPCVVAAMTELSKAETGHAILIATDGARLAIRNAIEEACEGDADFYAAGLRDS